MNNIHNHIYLELEEEEEKDEEEVEVEDEPEPVVELEPEIMRRRKSWRRSTVAVIRTISRRRVCCSTFGSTRPRIRLSEINKLGSIFREKVTAVYNARRPRGTFERNLRMLRSHFERADKDLKIFYGIYKQESEQYQSGASGTDILRAAMRVFITTPVELLNMPMFGRRFERLRAGKAAPHMRPLASSQHSI